MGLGQFSYANNSNRFLAAPELATSRSRWSACLLTAR